MGTTDPNRIVVDPAQPGDAFWPVSLRAHRELCAQLEAELKSALATIRALHRCPHCDRPLAPLPSRNQMATNSTPEIR